MQQCSLYLKRYREEVKIQVDSDGFIKGFGDEWHFLQSCEFWEFACTTQSNMDWPVFLTIWNKAPHVSQKERKNSYKDCLIWSKVCLRGNNCWLTFQKLMLVHFTLINLPVVIKMYLTHQNATSCFLYSLIRETSLQTFHDYKLCQKNRSLNYVYF